MKTVQEMAREAGAFIAADEFKGVTDDINFDSWAEVERFAALMRAQALDEAADKLRDLFAYRGGHGEQGAPGCEECVGALLALNGTGSPAQQTAKGE